MKKICCTIMALIGFILPTFSAQAITIDTFDPSTAQSISVTPSSPTAFNDFSLAQTYAIGGHRLVKSGPYISGVQTQTVDVMPSLPHSPFKVSISQPPGVKSNVSIIWDGTTHTTFSDPINYNGLGGFNLEAESSVSKFILKNVNHECGSPNTCSIKLTVYDQSSAAGNIIASSNSISVITTATEDLNFPFSGFSIASGASTPLTSFSNVGAIVLDISPGTSSDITFDDLVTDGISDCSSTPGIVPVHPAIIDQCSICDGDNSSCADCAGIPNGPSMPGISCSTGLPGVCSAGKWHQVSAGPPLNCSCESLTPSSSEICDAIDNDCDGNTDENAICAQPLTLNNPCVKDVKGDYYAKVRKDFELQYQTIRDTAYKVVGKPALRDRALAIIKLNEALRASTKKLISKLPKSEIFPNSACINIACASNSYAKELATLASNSSKWYTLAQRVIALMKESKANGACEGDANYCAIRIQLRTQEYNRILASMKKYVTSHTALSKKGPFTVKSCSLI